MLSLLSSQTVVCEAQRNGQTITTGNSTDDVECWHRVSGGPFAIFLETNDGAACRDCSAKRMSVVPIYKDVHG